jgi:hypothetical protein
MASNLLNVDDVTLASNSTATISKSLHIGQWPIDGVGPSGPAIAAIFGGSDNSILNDPVANAGKLFFHSNFDYLRIKSITDFTISLPARNTRSYGGGKKSGSGLLSYNGYSDGYIFQHDYGNPPPAFCVFFTQDPSNGSLAGLGLTGSLPLQFNSADTFRLGIAYSTNEYLVLRERYQVYSSSLAAVDLKARAYFFDNPTSVGAATIIQTVHTPPSFNEVSAYTGIAGRVLSNTITFNCFTPGDSFDKVEIMRVGGSITVTAPLANYISEINGTSVGELDSLNVWVPYTYSPSTTWSMTINSRRNAIGSAGVAYYNARWLVRFTNTTTGQKFIDAIGGIHTFLGP